MREANAEAGARGRQRGLWVRLSEKDSQQPIKRAGERKREGGGRWSGIK